MIRPTGIKPLDALIEKEGLTEYLRDYYAAVNGRLTLLYAEENFYIAEDTTYQPWLSVMGCLPEGMTEQKLSGLLADYFADKRYIAAYTNLLQVSELLQKCEAFTYHEDFLVAAVPETQDSDTSGIRLAGMADLPYVVETYPRSGQEQLQSRIVQKQMWVMEENACVVGYAGIHKDGSLGFEYVAPHARRRGIARKLQCYIANRMIESGMMPYVMVSVGNDVAKNLQMKLGSEFAHKLFYFYAKGSYEFE